MRCSRNMTTPIFIAKFKNGPYFEDKKHFYELLDLVKKTSSDCEFHQLDGTHHLHLNHPEDVAGLINKFISKHYQKGSNNEDIWDDILIDKKRSKL